MATYNPSTVPQTADALPQFLQQELRRIAQASSDGVDGIVLNAQATLPTKRIDGFTFRATAALAAANPTVLTGGAGVYTYYDGSFKKLG